MTARKPITKTELLLRILKRQGRPLTQAELWFYAKRHPSMKTSRRSLYGLLQAMVQRGYVVRKKNHLGAYAYQALGASGS
jgi:DNA-binding IclR family transcriptional regulator